MLYAKVVLGLPVEGAFDYIVPSGLRGKVKVGSRVRVNFSNRALVGYVVGLTSKTDIASLKEISALIDRHPILDKGMLSFAKKISDYYYCSWGEAIETALPLFLRRGIKAGLGSVSHSLEKTNSPQIILLHDPDGVSRWKIYLEEIKKSLKADRPAIILLPDLYSVLRAHDMLQPELPYALSVLYRGQPQETQEWLKIASGKVKIVIGTRSAIFAPLKNLGLVIIDEEQDSTYKQDQVPHYHAREAAIMRVGMEKAKLILASSALSLESIYLARKNKLKYTFIPGSKGFPEVKIIDMKSEYIRRNKGAVLPKYLQDAVAASIQNKEKALLFLNRKGFATYSLCNSCGKPLVCGRCSSNLVYHFKENSLSCRYCNFKMALPNICPNCNAGYIKLGGSGTERIENELARIFPSAKITRVDHPDDPEIKDADIVVSTSAIIKQGRYNFSLTGVLGIDNYLNRVDFRAGEKTFDLLFGLVSITTKKIIILTLSPGHHSFQALLKNDPAIFYDRELKQRKQLLFPPYRHLALVKLRGRIQEKVKELSFALFEKLNSAAKGRGLKVISVNPGHPDKLRGNFYWQILASSSSIKKLNGFLRINLKKFPHSGIIVTVDIDPL